MALPAKFKFETDVFSKEYSAAAGGKGLFTALRAE
jgi:hypothetical protein